MTLLYPLFLAGLAAIALPIVAHLFFRPRAKIVMFPTVRFLEESQAQETSRRRLRELILLLLRIAAVALLVLMFCQPLLENEAFTAEHHIIVWDDTWSMQYAEGDRSVQAALQARLRELLNDMSFADRASIVTLTGRTRSAVGLKKDEALSFVDSIPVSYDHPDVGEAMAAVTEIADAMRSDRKQTMRVFSDLQQSTWDWVIGRPASRQVPLDAVEVVGPDIMEKTNLAVGGARFESSAGQTAKCRVLNYSDKPVEGLIRVACNNVALGSAPVRVDSRSYRTVDLEINWPSGMEGTLPVSFDLEASDGLALDNRFYSVVTRHTGGAPLLLIEGRQGNSYLVRKALETLRVRRAILSFDIATALDSDLRSYQMIILTHPPELSDDSTASLREFLQKGGVLLTFLGGDTDTRTYRTLHDNGLLPLKPESFSPKHRRLVSVDLQHELTRDLAAYYPDQVVSYGCFEVQTAPGAVVPAVLEEDIPFVAVRDVGAGVSVVINASADDELSNFAKTPLLLPLLDRI
ncbi:MAG: BatA domain-containing protein, partial [Lentisphaerae bacterium]|nr:BatA domain-containing protein [Lentisphaerota bacterium]